jgi:hypothetical protein
MGATKKGWSKNILELLIWLGDVVITSGRRLPFVWSKDIFRRNAFVRISTKQFFFCQELETARHVSVTLTCQPVRLSSSNSNAIHARITGNDGANLAARLDQKTSGLRMTIGEHEGDPSDEGNEQSFQRTLTRRPRHSVDANGFEWPRSVRPLRLLLGGCDMRPAVKKKRAQVPCFTSFFAVFFFLVWQNEVCNLYYDGPRTMAAGMIPLPFSFHWFLRFSGQKQRVRRLLSRSMVYWSTKKPWCVFICFKPAL